MRRKILVLAACAALALVALPAIPADASVLGGRFVGCYGIKKKGNYNRVRASGVGLAKGSRVAARGSLAVTRSCQRVNSLPVTEMHVYKVQLRRADGKVKATAGPVGTHRKASISATTRYVAVACHVGLQVWEDIGYTYYDRSHVRPFWIHGPTFYRC